MDGVAILGTLCLAALALVRPRALSRVRRACLQAAAGFTAMLVAVRFLVDRVPLLPNTPIYRIAAYAGHELTRASLERPAHLLVIDGGSASCRGLDGSLLEHQLRAAGMDAQVIQISRAGANHLEPSHIYASVLKLLDDHTLAALRQIDVVWLRETHLDYDSHPLAQFARNRMTSRAIGYIDLETSRDALLLQNPDIPLTELWDVVRDLLSHVLLSEFHVSAMHRLLPPDRLRREMGYKPVPGPRKRL